MKDWTEFAGWLGNQLKKLGVSRYWLVKRTGISHCAITQYINQIRAPHLDIFLRIVTAFGKKILIVDQNYPEQPIVRCKDCKHYHSGFNCDLLQKPFERSAEDYFCADGEVDE